MKHIFKHLIFSILFLAGNWLPAQTIEVSLDRACNFKANTPFQLNLSDTTHYNNMVHRLVITDTVGIIQQIQTTSTFAGMSAGNYLVYPLQYDTTESITALEIDSSIHRVNGTCLDIGASLAVNICDCHGEEGIINFSNSGAYTDTGFQQQFLLTNHKFEILAIRNMPTFENLSNGVYNVFALNQDVTETLSNVTVGNVVFDISGNCFELSNPLGFVICQPPRLGLRVLLQGALFGHTDTLMQDRLRQQGFLPREQPYQEANLGERFKQIDGGNEVADTTLFVANAGTADAIVDWVFIEFRDTSNQSVFKTQSALVQRDGDVVTPTNGQYLRLDSFPAAFYVSIKHRNHLGVMTAQPLVIDRDTLYFDFTKDVPSEIATVHNGYDNLAMVKIHGKYALWAGNCLNDARVKYNGAENDQLDVLENVVLAPNNTTQAKNYAKTYGYYSGDVNMDGITKFEGYNNDRILIQYVVLNYHLNTLRLSNYGNLLEQLP